MIVHLFEESLKQTEQYRGKYQNSLFKNILPENHSFQFPAKPPIPSELRGKSNRRSLINNLELNSSSDRNTLIGHYEMTHIINPVKKIFSSSTDQLNQFNEKFFYQSFDSYSAYLNQLMTIYFHENEIYDHYQFQLKLLSLTEQIKDLFKKLYQRYRIVVHLCLYQNLDQSMIILFKSLLNPNLDYFYQFHFHQKNFRILLNIFFLQKE